MKERRRERGRERGLMIGFGGSTVLAIIILVMSLILMINHNPDVKNYIYIVVVINLIFGFYGIGHLPGDD